MFGSASHFMDLARDAIRALNDIARALQAQNKTLERMNDHLREFNKVLRESTDQQNDALIRLGVTTAGFKEAAGIRGPSSSGTGFNKDGANS